MPSIPCPQCKTNIYFNANDMLLGKHFACTNCNVVLSIPNEEYEIRIKNAQGQLDALKDELDTD